MHRSRIRHLRPSGRLIISLLMTAIMVAGISGGMTTTVAAQDAETLLDQTTVEWDAPWQQVDPNAPLGSSLTTNLPGLDAGNRLDLQNDNAYFVLGLTDSATDIDTAANAVLTSIVQDPTNAVNVAGGGSETVGAGGVVMTSTDYSVYVFNQNGEDVGVYVQLDNGTMLQVLIARPSAFADQMTSAQSTISVNGVGVFGGANGVDAATSMAGRPGEAPPITSDAPATDAAAGEQYTIPTGNVNVVWPAGWSVVGQDDAGIELANPSQTMHLTINGFPLDGATWEQDAAASVAYLHDDQGANATISGPVVTESGYMFTTDGQYGPRIAQGFAASDPAFGVLVFAAHIAPGSDLTALATEARGVTVNGVPALQGIEAVIPAATAAGVGGEYLIPNYNLQVAWPAGWSIVSQDDAGIVLLNAAETIELTIVGDPLNGRTVDDWAADGEFSFSHDQGANATISGPVVTDSGWMLATDGDFGPRLAQGSASSDPAIGVTVFAAHIPAGSDLIAVATETHGVTVDGNPVLQGIEAVIPPAA